MTAPVPSPRLIIKIGPDSGKEYSITEAVTIVGRRHPSHLVVEHPLVSSEHAKITWVENRWYIEDLDSKNGTFVNRKKVSERQEIIDQDEIGLGPVLRLVFLTKAEAEKPRADEISPEQRQKKPAGAFETIIRPGATGLPPAPKSQQASQPFIEITIAGQGTQTYPLNKNLITIGRADDNDIVIQSMIISRRHAVLRRVEDGYDLEVLAGALNTLTCQGQPVHTHRLLENGDVLRVDSDIPGNMVSITFTDPNKKVLSAPFGIQFGQKDSLTLGRSPENDVILDMPNVSRFHAQITRVGKRYYVTDLHSANGTFVNDKKVVGNVWLEPYDTLRISQYRLVLGEDQFTRYDESQTGVRVHAYHLNKWVRKDLNLLQDISLSFQPREFIVIVGQSGGGKSTLLDAIAGYRPATQGKVIINGIDIYQNFDAIRNEIGYVPQKDIIHMELTVYQALNYAAELRMPRDTSAQERKKRIMEVLADLDLTHRKDMQISGLSGGQQKRVSIGVELLTRPSLFFLDEPTSGLDPGTETTFMHLMRRLADQGRTIILVTHATKNVMLSDKVVFLARGGHVAWYGPPDEALTYFDQYRSESERRINSMEFDAIYSILDNPQKGKGSEWAQRYQADPAYGKYIVDPLSGKQDQSAGQPAKRTKTASKNLAKRSSLQQFFVLIRRNLAILRRDKSALFLMLAAAPVVGALDLLLAPAMGKAPYNYMDGDAHNGAITLFLMMLFALLVGGMSQMREFVKEGHIYKRERLVNLRILPYVSSKVVVAILLAFWHALAYTGIHYLAFRMPGNFMDFLAIYISMVFAVFSGMLLGLLASAMSPNSASAPLTTIVLIIPLIVLSGVLAPIPPNISQIASTRWAFQSLLGITGTGSDVASDICWQLDKELRDAMTLEDKLIHGCKCMGVQMFNENTCNFPGVGQYYAAEIDQVEPTRPPDLAEPPGEPVIPEPPTPPEDKYDQVQTAQYLNSLVSYQDLVRNIQANYRNEMDLYRVQSDVYAGQMTEFQEDLAKYNIARVSAVKSAEGVIEKTNEMFAWTWVNKDDPGIYLPWLLNTWLAQVKICAVYFILILILIKRKDAQ